MYMHASGSMRDAWSVDDFLVGGAVLVPDLIDEMFELEPSADVFLFWPGGRVQEFCVSDAL